ncbi:hypothetical protein ACVIEM_000648 [Rhizobium leguminosarum]
MRLVFQLNVTGEGLRRAEFVNDDGVVDDEIDGNERVDLLGIAAERHHRVAHGGKIDDGGNAGEVLHQHARRAIGDFVFDRTLVVQPFGNGQDVLLGDRLAVFEAQQVFKQHFHRIGKLRHAGQTVCLSLGQAVIDIVLPVDGKRGTTIETVKRFRHEIPRF